MIATFTTSGILSTCLLSRGKMVDAEEGVRQQEQIQSNKNSDIVKYVGFQIIDGKTYYFGKKNDGTGLAEGEKAIWTVKINGEPHYFSDDGSAWAENSWLADYKQASAPNTWYILERGKMASGFQTIDGKMYYFDPNNGYRMTTDWQKIDGYWYYFKSNGEMVTSI